MLNANLILKNIQKFDKISLKNKRLKKPNSLSIYERFKTQIKLNRRIQAKIKEAKSVIYELSRAA